MYKMSCLVIIKLLADDVKLIIIEFNFSLF